MTDDMDLEDSNSEASIGNSAEDSDSEQTKPKKLPRKLSTEPEKKRGRGRPRKYPTKEPEPKPDVPKRPRGRPRKYPREPPDETPPTNKSELTSDNESSLNESINESFTDQSSFSPKALKAEQMDIDSSSSSDKDSDHSEDPPASPIEHPTPPKRGRGRPRKYQKTDSQSTPIDKEPEPDTPPVAKRGRGRPRKYPIEPGSETPPKPPKKSKNKLTKRTIRTRSSIADDSEEKSDEKSESKTDEKSEKETRASKSDQKSHKSESSSKREPAKKKKPPKKSKPPKKPTIVAFRRFALPNHSDESDAESESDRVVLDDSEEESSLFHAFEDEHISHTSKQFPLRKTELTRANRALEKRNKLNQILTERHFDSGSLRVFELQFKEALQTFLPQANQIFYAQNRVLVCPTCFRAICHAHCPLASYMEKVQDLLAWMVKSSWNPKKPYVGFEHLFLEESVKIHEEYSERLKSFLENFSERTEIVNGTVTHQQLLETFEFIQPLLGYVLRKLRIKEIRPVRLQKALDRLLRMEFDQVKSDDSHLLEKIAKALFWVQSSNLELGQIWTELPGLSSDDLLARFPDADSRLRTFVEFTKLLSSVTLKLTSPQDSETEAFLNSDDWGLNLKFIEQGSASPETNPKGIGMFCYISSRQSPATIAKTLLKRLRKDFELDIEKQSICDSSEEIAAYSGSDSGQEHQILCVADNWTERQVHLFVRVISPENLKIEHLTRGEVKKYFRGSEEIDENFAVLPYNHQFTTIADGLRLSILTGDDSDSLYPSTVIKGSKDDEEVIRCVMTWCKNFELHQNGPTIQLLAVKKPYRRQGIATALLQWIEQDFLAFWLPKAKQFFLYASYVVAGHDFFLKNGFDFCDYYHEEMVKTVVRSKDKLTK